jgi:hypothetical protein
VSDLRDSIYKLAPEATPEAKLFLEYHRHSSWAVAKVQAGLRVPPESIGYMQSEVDARARARAAREAIAKEIEDEKSALETPAPGAATWSEPAPDGVGGVAGTAAEGAGAV